jgi:hypothetical protein
VEEVKPAVVDLKAGVCSLGSRLVEERTEAPIVEFPDDGRSRERSSVADRRAGLVLTESGGVDDECTWWQRFEPGVVVGGRVDLDVGDFVAADVRKSA